MKKILLIIGLFIISATATFGQDSYEDRYFYDESFDWRWDVRVRISDGINSGSLTSREARRLYNRLERIERCEYDYQRDGYFSAREQDEVWDDVMDLNRRIGLELNDWDRSYYGYSRPGYAYRGNFNWYNGSYDFYRFDRRGFGSISLGYRPTFYVPRIERSYGYHYNNNRNNWNKNNNSNWNRNNNRRDNDNNRRDNNRRDNDNDRRRDNRNDGRFGSNDRNRSESINPRGTERPTRSESREEIQTPRPANRPSNTEEIQTPRSYDRPFRTEKRENSAPSRSFERPSRTESREESRSIERPSRSNRSEAREESRSNERASRGSRDESRNNSRNLKDRANDSAPSRGNNN